MEPLKKKTPREVGDFEREQLRFFLSSGDVAAGLADINPSLAWLPELVRMNVAWDPSQLARWIGRNFADPEAVREVAANLEYFDETTADLLEFRRQIPPLSPLLAKSWNLIISHIRNSRRGMLQSDWYELQPRLKAGDRSPEVLAKLADLLRPKPKLGKRFSWHDVNESDNQPNRPADLMSIDYEVQDGVSETAVLEMWPKDTLVDTDRRLLSTLADSLDAALEGAIDAEVEDNASYSISDTDVPSVAAHRQNRHRTGFLPIVRVIAEIWSRLAAKTPAGALAFVQRWSTSFLKMDRRLALYAAADTAVPATEAADVLVALPQSLLFFTNTTVEVFRLMHARWKDFPREKREEIERRIIEGPPRDRFRTDDIEIRIDRSRYDVLGEMQRAGLELTQTSTSLLTAIQSKYPNWELRPAEQAGFHIWHGDAAWIRGDSTRFKNIPDDLLIDEAKKASDSADFLDGDHWQALCQSEPQRALRGLNAKAGMGQWPAWAWNPFLWAGQKLDDTDSVNLVGDLLLKFPMREFSEVANTASWWLDEKTKVLHENLLWALWDKIEGATRPQLTEEGHSLTDALNAPPGRLAEVLIKRMALGTRGGEIPSVIRDRLDKLVSGTDNFGRLARVYLAAEVSLLFERARDWTRERVVPLFDWSSAEAPYAWSARKYSNFIGSPQLFDLTKEWFLALFARPKIGEDDLEAFGDWLALIMIANQARNAGYPISTTEARTALRSAGARVLSTVAHRLAIELEAIEPGEKPAFWHNVIGPVFEAIWPLDAELQSPRATFKLVQILLATGDAFPHAADVIIPFIRPEDPRQHTSIYSLSSAGDDLYLSSPGKMLDLAAAIVGDASTQGIYGLADVLNRIRQRAPHLVNTRKFQRLASLAGAN